MVQLTKKKGIKMNTTEMKARLWEILATKEGLEKEYEVLLKKLVEAEKKAKETPKAE